MELRELVERGVILRATVGSTVHGLHHGGQDDRDEMAVFVEPPEYRLGLKLARAQGRKLHPLEHWVERTQPEGVRSGPGRPRSRRVQPAQVRSAGAEGPPDRAPAPVRARPSSPMSRPTWARAARPHRRDPLQARRSRLPRLPRRPARAAARERGARSGSTGPSSSRRTGTTRSTRCTRSASATRASSSWRRAGSRCRCRSRSARA